MCWTSKFWLLLQLDFYVLISFTNSTFAHFNRFLHRANNKSQTEQSLLVFLAFYCWTPHNLFFLFSEQTTVFEQIVFNNLVNNFNNLINFNNLTKHFMLQILHTTISVDGYVHLCLMSCIYNRPNHWWCLKDVSLEVVSSDRPTVPDWEVALI